MAIALSKELIKEMNLFSGESRTRVVDFGDNLPKDHHQCITDLKGFVAQLPASQQEQLKSFIELMHRISLHREQNQMHAANIAVSLNDTLSPSQDGGGFEGMQAIQDFTRLLIENYEEVFLSSNS